MKRQRRTFTTEFKLKKFQLASSGKPRTDIVRKYDLTASALDSWIKSPTIRLFHVKDNRSEEDNELIRLRKENQRLLIRTKF